MTKVGATFGLFLVLLGTAVAANEVIVRAGDHKNFTRLVLTVPKGTKWEVDNDNDQFVIQLSGHQTFTFNTKSTFDRISRKRIDEASSRGSKELVVALNCNCETRAFFEEPNLIVVDVKDETNAINMRSLDATNLSEFVPAPSVSKTSVEIEKNLLRTGKPYSPTASKRLAEKVAKAATRQTLLQVTHSGAAATLNDLTASGDVELERAARNIALAGEANLTQNHGGLGSGACSALAKTPLGVLDHNLAFYSQLGMLQSGIYDAHGKVIRSSLVRLSQWYLSHGMATEAKRYIEMLPAEDNEKTLLIALSSVIGDFDSQVTQTILDQAHCSDFMSLFAFLSDSVDSKSLTSDNSLEQATIKLPRELLKELAPRLIEKFQTVGLTSAAFNTDKLVDRQRLAAQGGDVDGATSVDQVKPAPQLDLVNYATDQVLSKVEIGETVTEKDLDLVASVAFETRIDEKSETAARAEIFALISRGRFEDADRKLRLSRLSPATKSHLRKHNYSDLVGKANSMQFLKFVTNEMESIAQKADAGTRSKILARLKDLNFPELASEVDKLAKMHEPRLEKLRADFKENRGREFTPVVVGSHGKTKPNHDRSKPVLVDPNVSAKKTLEQEQAIELTMKNMMDLANSSKELATSVQSLIDEDLGI